MTLILKLLTMLDLWLVLIDKIQHKACKEKVDEELLPVA